MYLGLESVVKVKASPTSEKSPPAKLSETEEMLENALSFSVKVRAPLVPLVIKISGMMIWLLVISSARSRLNVLADDPARFVKARKVIAAERSRKDRRSNAHSLIDPCAERSTPSAFRLSKTLRRMYSDFDWRSAVGRSAPARTRFMPAPARRLMR